MSSIPQDKQTLIASIEKALTKLNKKLHNINPKITNDAILDGQVKYTKVSVCNLLAYLRGWSDLMLVWITKKPTNDLLPEGYSFAPKDLGRLAQQFYKGYEHLAFEELVNKLNDSYQQLLPKIQKETNESLYEKSFYTKYTLGRMIDFNTPCPLNNIYHRLGRAEG